MLVVVVGSATVFDDEGFAEGSLTSPGKMIMAEAVVPSSPSYLSFSPRRPTFPPAQKGAAAII